jgi:hypothetical protein
LNVKRTWLRPAVIAVAAGSLILAACSSNPDRSGDASADPGRTEGGELAGTITISGSSTV